MLCVVRVDASERCREYSPSIVRSDGLDGRAQDESVRALESPKPCGQGTPRDGSPLKGIRRRDHF